MFFLIFENPHVPDLFYLKELQFYISIVGVKLTKLTIKTKMGKTERIAKLPSVAELELVKAKSAIDQFIYSCSHTMRGPLKSIMGLVNLLRNADEKMDINPQVYLKSIEATVAKMESVLTELEQFLTNTSQNIVTKPIDVKDFVNQILEDFKPRIEESKIVLVIKVNQMAPLYTDVNRLRVVFTHLISNAIIYQDPKKKKKTVDIFVRVNETSCAVQIRDNGIGMIEEVQSNLFQLFYRGTELSSGAGVGLYITKEVLTKMLGKISVTSIVAKGSCFSFSIPNLST